MSEAAVIRELMLALEFTRSACEHVTGETKEDCDRLAAAMSVGIRVLGKHRALAPDFHMPTWWEAVRALPLQIDESKHDWVWVLRAVGYDHYRCRRCAADWMDSDPVPAACVPPRVERMLKSR